MLDELCLGLLESSSLALLKDLRYKRGLLVNFGGSSSYAILVLELCHVLTMFRCANQLGL